MQNSFSDLLGSIRDEHERVVDELQLEIAAMRTLLCTRGTAAFEQQVLVPHFHVQTLPDTDKKNLHTNQVIEQCASKPATEKLQEGLQQEFTSPMTSGEPAPAPPSGTASSETLEKSKEECEISAILDGENQRSMQIQENTPNSADQSLRRRITLFASPSSNRSRQQQANLSWCKRVGNFLDGSTFEGFAATLIVLDTFVMAVESQYLGYKAGIIVNYPGMISPTDEVWGSNAESVFNALQRFFTVIFTAELLIRIGFHQYRWAINPINWIDALLVGAALVDWAADSGSNLALARVLRLLKLSRGLRVVRMLKIAKVLESLHLLLKCLSSSIGTLFWAFSILTLIQTIAAMLFSQSVRNYLEDTTIDLQKRQQVFSYYGTFSRSMLTMFEIMLANWAESCRILVNNVSEFYSLAFMLYRCCLGYAVLNVINAVFIQQTLRVAQNDKDVMIMQRKREQRDYARKLKALFSHVDTSGDGFVSWDEFNTLMDDPHLKTWMSALELDSHDLEGLFGLIDTGSGQISVDEFVHRASVLKGGARAIDMAQLLAKVTRIEQKIDVHCFEDDLLRI